jgi:hypothetical protein
LGSGIFGVNQESVGSNLAPKSPAKGICGVCHSLPDQFHVADCGIPEIAIRRSWVNQSFSKDPAVNSAQSGNLRLLDRSPCRILKVRNNKVRQSSSLKVGGLLKLYGNWPEA